MDGSMEVEKMSSLPSIPPGMEFRKVGSVYRFVPTQVGVMTFDLKTISKKVYEVVTRTTDGIEDISVHDFIKFYTWKSVGNVIRETDGVINTNEIHKPGSVYRLSDGTILDSRVLAVPMVQDAKKFKKETVKAKLTGKIKGEFMGEESNQKKPYYVHVTELAKGDSVCDRAIEYKLKGTVGNNPKRWVSMKGSVVHALLDHYVQKRKFGDEDVDEVLAPFLKELGMTKDSQAYKTEIEEDLLPMLAKEIVYLQKYLKEAAQVHTEFNVKVVTDDTLADGTPIVITGTMDLVLVGADGGVTVIDYKTGQKAMPGHQAQVNTYMHMLEDVNPLSLPVPIDFKPAEIHYLGKGDTVKLVKVTKTSDAGLAKTVKAYVSNVVEIQERLQKSGGTECHEGYTCMFCPWFATPCRGI
jgi:hypothetical protein